MINKMKKILKLLGVGAALFLATGLWAQEENLVSVEPGFGEWSMWNPVFTQNDIRFLPNGSHAFSFLENWYHNIVLSNIDTGGFSMLEPVRGTLQGDSTQWLKHRFNGVEINDPLRPGKPLIYVPNHLWSSFEVHYQLSSYQLDQGLNWVSDISEASGYRVRLANPGLLGGETWVPPNFTDRQPATSWGASHDRRAMSSAFEGEFSGAFPAIGGRPFYFFYEGVAHNRHFINTSDLDEGSRHSAYVAQQLSPESQTGLMYQGQDRSRFGAEIGNNSSTHLSGREDAFLWQYTKTDSSLSYGVNAGYKRSRYEQNQATPMVWSLVEELHSGKAPVPSDSSSWFAGGYFQTGGLFQLFEEDISLRTPWRFEGGSERYLYQQSMVARTWQGLPLDITYYDQNQEFSHQVARLYPRLQLEKNWGDLSLKAGAGASLEAGFANSSIAPFLMEPVGEVTLTYRPAPAWEIFTGLLHDAVPLGANEMRFINKSSPSGGRYAWNDNGDLVPQLSELGTLYNRTGGSSHTVDPALRPPTRNELYAGAKYNIDDLWSTSFSLHGKLLHDLYTVRFDPSYDSGYYKIGRSDVEAGYLYNRDPAAMGNELYMLTNQIEPGYFLALELQFLKVGDIESPWFFNMTIGAYYFQAITTHGNGPDYNDIGMISEDSADPNKRIYELARPDSDRGYKIHMLFGWRPFAGFTWSTLFYYRDGEPFGQMVVAEGLTQGPTTVQNMMRSNPPEGMPRYTYFISMDMRFSYELEWLSNQTSVTFDIYNLLDSRTELYEYHLAGAQYRDSMEMGIGRSYRISIDYRWR